MTPGRREPLVEGVLPNGEVGVYSAVLGLWAYVAERTPLSSRRYTRALTMRWYDPATGANIPDYESQKARADAAETRADAAEVRAEAAHNEAQAARRRIAELEERLRRRGEL